MNLKNICYQNKFILLYAILFEKSIILLNLRRDFMVDKIKVINFLQDLGCAKLNQLQILYDEKENNFKNILQGNMVSGKSDIFDKINIIQYNNK